ncbi:3-oxoacyl-[acyl-carrier-protein] reductase FabG [Clostridium bornimense]|uniref:3-oxoacyl-[acyl-carrier-protein] reductase n=1 Tax=Clostridium bornimense TaxID=1216932 RepID=W6RZ63_9CLOT|nr:3-oxoacyl-[acyl-carrier-protein] reductase [Clostridium bornimense]CDM69773.1 3-oxoacyl-[acyl-carrier-protein] reductase FabG [Clostridium bornimense]
MLKGKVALITGATRGIGKAIALKFAENGADIALNYRRDNEDLKNLVRELECKGVKVLPVQGDVAILEDANRIVKETVEGLGKLDILVNNAGITKDGLIIRMKEEDFDSVINTNLKGTFNTVKAATSIMMKQRSGKIINISSVVGLVGNAGQSNYSASKAGIIGLTKSIARELGGRGINVNAIAPGFIQTDMTEVLPDKLKESMETSIPLKKLGNPEDVANLALFLGSNLSDYITGQVIAVDGGMTMN